MIENYPTHNNPTPRGALQIGLQAREMEKQQARLTASIRAAGSSQTTQRFANPFKSLLSNLFGSMRVDHANRELASVARK